MSRTRFRIVIFLLGLACCPAAAKAASVKDTIKLGWQVPWATQGQLVMALRNTNALALVGQDVEFVGFSYGAPLNSAALAGKVDVLLTADQPAITLLARDPSFRIVARMMYNQACIYVSSKSKTTKLNELAGRTVMGPVGAAAERIAVNALKNAGVDLGTVTFGQLDMAQQASMLRRSAGEGRWPDVDALYGFDPFPAVFEEAGHARILDCGRIVSVVVASSDMVTRRKADLAKFLGGFALAWHYFATHPDAANRWFVQESRLEVSHAILDRCAAAEPNRSATTLAALRLDFDDSDIASLRETSRFLKDRGVTQQQVDPVRLIDLGALRTALDRRDLAGMTARVAPK